MQYDYWCLCHAYRIPFDIFCNTSREAFIILEVNPSNVSPIGKIEYYL